MFPSPPSSANTLRRRSAQSIKLPVHRSQPFVPCSAAMYILFSLHIDSVEFQLMGAFGDNGKLYLHAGDIAKILKRDAVDGWIKDNGHVVFGDIRLHCDSIMQKTWAMELSGLINFLYNMRPVFGSDLYHILTNDKVAKYQKNSTPEIVARNIRHLTENDLRWSQAPVLQLMMVSGNARKHKPTAPAFTDLLPTDIFEDDLFIDLEQQSSLGPISPPASKPDPVHSSVLKKLLSPPGQLQQKSNSSGSQVTAESNGLLMIAKPPSPNRSALMPPALPIPPYYTIHYPRNKSKTRPNILQHQIMMPKFSSSSVMMPPPPPASPFVTTPPLHNTRPNILRK